MRKLLNILLYPLAIILVILGFLHLSFVINYKNIDETYIGLSLLLLSNIMCLFYIYNYSNKKEIEYIISFISFICWIIMVLQNMFGIIEIPNQRIISFISTLFFIFILLPMAIGIIYYIKSIKKYYKTRSSN